MIRILLQTMMARRPRADAGGFGDPADKVNRVAHPIGGPSTGLALIGIGILALPLVECGGGIPTQLTWTKAGVDRDGYERESTSCLHGNDTARSTYEACMIAQGWTKN